MHRRWLVAVFALLLIASAAHAEKSYVLSASQWGAAQDAAVAAAGGTVTFSHAGAGVGVAKSSNPSFLDEALAGGAIQKGGEDIVVQWQAPVQEIDIAETGITPGDEPFFPFQWNMQAMQAPDAWAAGCTGKGVRVAVLDGGFHDTHPDLEPNLDKACSVSTVPGQPYNNDTGTFWHGTHVAGIVAAADNGRGVIGTAPEATLMGVKVLHSGSGTFGQVITGILYAADPGAFGFSNCERADIINMSLGAVFPKNGATAGLVAALNRAVTFAHQNGVLVVTSAGNAGFDFDQSFNFIVTPAENANALAISATGPVDFANGGSNYRRISSYTNTGQSLIHVAGPGGDFTLFPNGLWFFDMVLSACRGSGSGSWCFAAGTSMSSPAAAGVAALILEANPGMSPGQLGQKLAQTADDEGKPGHDNDYGRGFINAFRGCTE